ncbi:unnamed protein product [Adineta steineri]|uniref:Uncharacterized protein n=1 Tax=Adineta steineri TaxID=433720 RepID=A0A814TWN9_9BILA|nr:unnamed protein product [Adineta steineri]
MCRLSANIIPICFSYFLLIILLFQSTRPVQSLALSSLCGQFGHSCFGGNWGKRELLTSSIAPDFNTNEHEIITFTEDEKNLINNLLLEKMHVSMLQQRLRQLLKLE